MSKEMKPYLEIIAAQELEKMLGVELDDNKIAMLESYLLYKNPTAVGIESISREAYIKGVKDGLKESRYAIALDICYYDETVAILAEFKDGKVYIIKQKSSKGIGENKITENQMKEIYEFHAHYKLEPNMREYYANNYVPKILGWEEYNATVTID